MDLPLDVLRAIILICKIRDIKNLCLITKSFCSLCCEKNLWMEKFREKDLIIINDKINTINQYIEEYKKISYISHTTNYLFNMVGENYLSVPFHRCWFNPYFLIDDLVNILLKDHPIFEKISIYNNIKKYVDITIQIGGEKGMIDYYYHGTADLYGAGIILLSEIYDKNKIISLITKILYHYPSIIIYDAEYRPMIITENMLLDNISFDYVNQKIIDKRKKYWNECYSKYEELYY